MTDVPYSCANADSDLKKRLEYHNLVIDVKEKTSMDNIQQESVNISTNGCILQHWNRYKSWNSREWKNQKWMNERLNYWKNYTINYLT